MNIIESMSIDMKKESNEIILDAMIETAFREYMERKYDEDDLESSTEFIDDTSEEYKEKRRQIYENILFEANKKTRRNKRIAVLTTATLLIFLTLVSSVSAIRTFFLITYLDISKNFIHLVTDLKDGGYDDYKDIIMFERPDEIIIPTWLAKGVKPQITTDEKTNLLLEYVHENKYVNISETIIGTEYQNTFGVSLEGRNYKKYQNTILDMEATVIELKTEDGVLYLASFNSNDVNYLIHSNLEENEFNKFLKHLRFYKSKKNSRFY